MTSLKSKLSLCVYVLLAAAGGLAAADKLDLDRVKPVPANEPIPVADFFRPSMLRYPVLNQAGTHFAALVSAGSGHSELMVYDLEKAKFERLAGTFDRDIRGFYWLDDKRLIFSLTMEKRYAEGVLVADIDRLDRCYPVLQADAVYVLAVPKKSPQKPLVWIRQDAFDDGRDGGVVQLDALLDKGEVVRLGWVTLDAQTWATIGENNQRHVLKSYPAPEGGMVIGYLPDKDGELAFGITSKDGQKTLHRFADGRWSKCPVNLDQVDIFAYGEKPGELVVLAPRVAGKPRALQFMDAATGQLGDILLQGKDRDFTGWLYRHPVSHNILGVAYYRGGPQMVWFSEEYRAIQKIVEGYLPGLVVHIIDSDAAQRRFLVSAFSDRQPTTYYWLDLEKRMLGPIKCTAPWIDPARMQPMNIMPFKTRDGHQLDAYVTLPVGASKQHPAPLVVLPHGGPWVRDYWGYDGEAQFLASRGYAVMQPNYRGSPGYGWSFKIEDEWDFRSMHNDVTDATKTLLASGLIDPQRVAIMGGSFGGYLAISGAAFEPDFYRCAVTIAGIFDWAQVLQEDKYYQFDNIRYSTFKRWLGDPKKQREKFDAISPLRHIDQVKIPIFVAHGKDDPVADVAESRGLISELKKYQIPHEVMLVREEGHGMLRLGNQVELYTRIEAFLAKYLQPTPPAATATSAGSPP
ncbi:MAG: alpha/beta fold hydrolase [Opitutaceae bacterium]|nr:alpha/beta fold hydrolase [Opitutaceae bacterium]